MSSPFREKIVIFDTVLQNVSKKETFVNTFCKKRKDNIILGLYHPF
jgi:hypothetical protein